MTKLIASTAFIAAVFVPVAAFGQTASDTVIVSYADLDLGSEAGRSALLRRVAGATRQLCPRPHSASMVEAVSHRACVREAGASAQPQVRLAFARASGGTQIAMRADR